MPANTVYCWISCGSIYLKQIRNIINNYSVVIAKKWFVDDCSNNYIRRILRTVDHPSFNSSRQLSSRWWSDN